MKTFYKVVIFLIFFFSGMTGSSQILVPLETDYSRTLENWAIVNKINIPTFTKPVSVEFLGKIVNTDSLFAFGTNQPEEKKSWFIRKLCYENFLRVDTSDFSIALDPLFNLQLERDANSDKHWFTNTRGIRIFGRVGNNLFFESSFYENQATFPSYLSDYVNSSMVVPGQGFVRNFGSFDYSNASGSLYYQAGKHFEFSFGHGKFFVGDGYRSLLLSDNSFNFPYLRVTANFEKFQYTRIMAVLMSDSTPATSFGARDKKLAGFNILTFSPNYWFQFSFFEGTIWKYPNSDKNIHFDVNYLNPVIFINSVLPGTDCKSVLGTGLKINILKEIQLYNQIAADKTYTGSNSGIHFSWQAGAKYFNAFSLTHLYLQAEFNTSQKNAYENESDLLAYSHYYQPLAHPLGNNFKEWIIKAHYDLKRWQFNSQFNFANYGSDTLNTNLNNNSGINIYKFQIPFIGKGQQVNLFYSDFSIAYLINPKTNMRLETGCITRNAIYAGTKHNLTYFYISFITSLTNWYFDF
jgi:hypothetical protein